MTLTPSALLLLAVLTAPLVHGAGLEATSNPVLFSLPVGAPPAFQNVVILFNGLPATVIGVSASTTTGQNWLQVTAPSLVGSVSVSVNPNGLTAGTYNG